MKQFDHKGFGIVVEASGLFRVDGRPDLHTFDSMKLAKEGIDIALKKDRKPIKALMLAGPRYDRHGRGIVEVTVTSTNRGKWGGGDAWVKTAHGGRSKEAADDVYIDNEANRETMTQIIALTAEVKKLEDQIEKLKVRLSTIPVEGGTA